MIIGLTDAERAQHVPGKGIETYGVGKPTVAHLNLRRSLSYVYIIERVGNGAGKFFYRWINRDTGWPH